MLEVPGQPSLVYHRGANCHDNQQLGTVQTNLVEPLALLEKRQDGA
jgi:hypothetical protein